MVSLNYPCILPTFSPRNPWLMGSNLQRLGALGTPISAFFRLAVKELKFSSPLWVYIVNDRLSSPHGYIYILLNTRVSPI